MFVVVALACVACGVRPSARSPNLQRDVAFDSVNGLDVYAPTAAAAAPVIVWLHGGALVEGDKKTEQAIAERFVEAGFVTVVPNYRLSPAVSHPEHARDAAAAVSWALANARSYGGDPSRVFVGGYSAGAYLAALVVADAIPRGASACA
jgi:acetyl esterase/lipase